MKSFRIPVENLPPANKDGNHLVRIRVVSDDFNRRSAFSTLYSVESKGQIWPELVVPQVYRPSASVINIVWDTPSQYNFRKIERVNLVSNPSFEQNSFLWTLTSSSSSASIIRTTLDAKFGSASLRVNKSDTPLRVSTATKSSSAVPGKKYIASAYVKVPSGQEQTTLQIGIRFLNSSGSALSNIVSSSAQVITDADDWVRLSISDTCVENASRAQLFIIQPNAETSDQYFFIDAALLEEGDVLKDYFDGSTSITSGIIENYWTGPQNLSPSLQITDEEDNSNIIIHDHGTEWRIHDSDIYIQWDSDPFEYYGRNRDSDINVLIKPGATSVRIWVQASNYFPTRLEKFKLFDTGTLDIASL
jgi:hypothetical protein